MLFVSRICCVFVLLAAAISPNASAVEINQINDYVITGTGSEQGATQHMVSILNNDKTHMILMTCAKPTDEIIVLIMSINIKHMPISNTSEVVTNIKIDDTKTLNITWVSNKKNLLLRNYFATSMHEDGFINGLMTSKTIHIGLPGKLLYFDFSVANKHINRTLSKCVGENK